MEDATTPLGFVEAAERGYAALMRHTDGADEEPGLGGRLLYGGELDTSGRALTVAGNVAGAATLAATADAAAQRRAVREGTVDFLVTSLDEALRILKNEVRKHATVAVCVSVAPKEIERAMRERGVLPDLLGDAIHASLESGSAGTEDGRVLLRWRVDTAPARWMPKLDAWAEACLGSGDRVARRWLRLAPRYCGRAAMGLRVLRCPAQAARTFQANVRAAVQSGEIGVPVEMSTVAVCDLRSAECRGLQYGPRVR